MQNVSIIVRHPISLGTAAAGGLLAFVAGAVIALSAPVAMTGLYVTHGSNVSEPIPFVGAQQIAHNRSEEGLGGSGSVGGEQIAHNRAEEGLANP